MKKKKFVLGAVLASVLLTAGCPSDPEPAQPTPAPSSVSPSPEIDPGFGTEPSSSVSPIKE